MAGATPEDIAALNLRFSADISGAVKEMAKLSGVVEKAMSASARATEAANDKMAKDALRSAQKQTEAAHQVGAANDNAAKSALRNADAQQQALRRTQAGATNIASQAQDIAVQLQSGTSPLTIALQQGTQLGQVLQQAGQGGAGVFRQLAAGAMAFLNPITAITVAVIALGGYFVQSFLKGSKSADDLIKDLQDLQKVAEATGSTDLVLSVKAELDEAQTRQIVQQLQQQINQQFEKLGGPGPVSKFLDQFAKDFFDFSAVIEPFKSDEMDKLSQSIEKLFDASASGGEEAAAAVTRAGLAFEKMKDAIAVNDWEKAQKALDEIASVNLSSLGKGASEVRNNFVDSIGPVQQVIDKIKLLTGGQDAANARQKQFNDAIKKLQDVGKPAIDATVEAMRAYDEAVKIAGTDTTKLATAQETLAATMQGIRMDAFSKLPEVIDGATSSADDFAKMMGSAEGTAKNAASTASGHFQFLEGTWLTMVDKMRLGLGRTRQEILDMRNDPQIARGVFDQFTADNVAQLRDAKVAVTDTTKAMSHLFGVFGAIAVLKAPPGTMLKDVVGKDAITANKGLLSMTQTVEQATAAVSAFYLKRRQNVAPTLNEELITSGEKLVAQTQAEIAISNDKTLSYVQQQGAIARLRAEEEARAKILKANGDLNKQDLADIKRAGDLAYEAAAATAADTEAKRNNKVWTDLMAKSQIEAAKSGEELNKQAQQNSQMFAQLGSSFIQSFVGGLRQGKSAADAMKESLIQLADQILSMILNKALSSLGDSLFGVVKHAGGPVESGPTRRLSPYTFIGAPRMASGGFLGVRPGEIPIIAHRGEVVIPASMVRQAARMGAGGQSQGGTNISVGDISIATSMQGTGDVKADSQRGREFGLRVKAIVQTEIQRQSRPGGILTASGSGARVGR